TLVCSWFTLPFGLVSLLPLAAQRGDARIRGERCGTKLQTKLGKLTDRAGAVGVQIEPPRLTLDRLSRCERSTHQQSDVDATGIARRGIAQHLDFGFASRVGQRL